MAVTGVLIFIMLFLCIMLLIVGAGIANYVLVALGLYRMAQKRNIENPWLAWIPTINCWITGALAEQCDMKRGQKRPWKMTLLVLAIANIACVVIGQFVSVFVSFIPASLVAMIEGETVVTGVFSVVLIVIFIVLMFAAMIVSIAQMTFIYCQMICMYKIFESEVPAKAVKYIILYMLVPFAGGICLLKSAKAEV